jgi:hypothetical protein
MMFLMMCQVRCALRSSWIVILKFKFESSQMGFFFGEILAVVVCVLRMYIGNLFRFGLLYDISPMSIH